MLKYCCHTYWVTVFQVKSQALIPVQPSAVVYPPPSQMITTNQASTCYEGLLLRGTIARLAEHALTEIQPKRSGLSITLADQGQTNNPKCNP